MSFVIVTLIRTLDGVSDAVLLTLLAYSSFTSITLYVNETGY